MTYDLILLERLNENLERINDTLRELVKLLEKK